MRKRILGIGMALMMLFTVVTFAGCAYEYEEGDFVLTISMSSDTFTQAESVYVDLTLKNLSGRSHRIAVLIDISGIPEIPGVFFPHSTVPGDSTYFIQFERDGSIQWTERLKPYFMFEHIAGIFSPGVYELTMRTVFNLNYGRSNQQNIQVFSNIIVFTVLEN